MSGQRSETAAPTDPHFVYVIGGSTGPIKIGISNSPQRRLCDLERAGYNGLRLIREYEAAGERRATSIERYAHWWLRDFRYQGEWFNVTQAEAIDAVERGALVQTHPLYMFPSINPARRPSPFPEKGNFRFPEGTLERIEAVIGEDEDHNDFMREAAERELKRRERQAEAGVLFLEPGVNRDGGAGVRLRGEK